MSEDLPKRLRQLAKEMTEGDPKTASMLILAAKELEGPDAGKPAAWIATSRRGQVLHLAEEDGWKVERVLFDGRISGPSIK